MTHITCKLAWSDSQSHFFFLFVFCTLERSTVPSPKELRSTWSRVKTATIVSDTFMTTQHWTFRILKWSKSQENLFFSSFAVDVVPKPSTLGRRSPMPLYVLTEDVSPPSSFGINKNNTQQWHNVWSPELYKMICYSVTWSLKLFIKNQHPLKTSPQSYRQVFLGEKIRIKKTSNSDDDDNVNLILNIFTVSHFL